MRAGPERWLVVVAALAAFVAPALAEPSEADLAFKKGRELSKAGKYAEACEQFERSQSLDPQLGTLFNIAQCDAEIGKLASALIAYREVIAKDTNPTRKATATDLVSKLEGRVPKLVVQVMGSPPGLEVKLDDKRELTANKPVEVDFGEYQLAVHADGRREFTSKVRIAEEGRTTTIVAVLVPDPSATATPTPKPKPKPTVAAVKPTAAPVADEPVAPAPRSRRKLYAVATIATGGAAIVTGLVFGALASSKWTDAKAVCGGTTCATQDELDRAAALGSQAHSRASVSTALFLVGGAIAAAGVVVWVTTPPSVGAHEVEVAAHASPDGAAFTISGRF